LVERALASVPARVRDEFLAATPIGWMRVSTLETIYRELGRETGRDPAELHIEIGRLGIERTLKTLWRLFLRITSDAALVARTPIIFNKSFDRGKLSSHIPGPGYAELHLTGWPGVGEFPLRSTCNGIATVLTLAGRENVRVAVRERTADGAKLVATWKT